MATVTYDTLPFAEQIAFFRAKRDVLTESYLDVFGAQHDVAFMVAGASRADLLADFKTAIDRAIAEGATLAEFRRDFDRIVATYGWDYTGGRNWRSRVIYETNLRQSYNAGRWAQLQRLKRARPYWRYRHSDAVEHPRPEHLGWDGLVLHVDDVWWHTHFPSNGWGCFLPGTRVASDIEVGLKARYAGPAVQIETQGGRCLRVTANHPILTARGWLPADEIEKGDQLLDCIGRIDPSLAVVVDHEQAPTRVEDAFDALATQGLSIAKVSPDDLHGDAQFGEPEIEVAAGSWLLRHGLQAAPLHLGQERSTEPGHARKTDLPASAVGASVRHTARFDTTHAQDVVHAILTEPGQLGDLSYGERRVEIVGDDFLLDSIVRRSGTLPGAAELPLDECAIAADSAPADVLRFTAAANLQTSSTQVSDDGLPSASVLFGELLNRSPGLVSIDQVIRISKFDWTGHVFDFQTSNHLIVAEGIVAHNCQCYVEALNERDLRRLGKKGPDQAPPIEWEEKLIGQRSPSGPREVQTPRGVDPGFGYAPGRSVDGGPPPRVPDTPPSLAGTLERTTRVALEKAAQLPEELAAQYIEQLRAMPRVNAVIESLRTRQLLDETVLKLLRKSP